jgi:hypothetical protein
MYSQTFVARDLFSQYWAIVICGFLVDRASGAMASDGLNEFVVARRQGHRRFAALVTDYARFDPAVMTIAEEAAPWASKQPTDLSYYAMDVSLMVGRLVTEDELGGEFAHELLMDAAKNSVLRFVDAFVCAVFAFGGASDSVVEQCSRVLGELAGIVGQNAQLADLVRNGAGLWLHEKSLETLGAATEPFRAWLESLPLRDPSSTRK